MQPEMPDALCAQMDSELWFPAKGGETDTVKRICQRCPHLTQCRDWAVSQPGLEGIWGGLSYVERQIVRRGGRLPVCERCGKRFTRQTSLDYHLREACKVVAA